MPSEPTAYVYVPVKIPQDTAVILNKLDSFFRAADDLKNLGESLANQLRTRAQDSNYKLVAFIVFAKAFKTFQAALLLCISRYGSDALSLCASLFENVVDLLYMAKAAVIRPLRYLQFEQVEKFFRAEKVLEKKRLPRGRRERYQSYQKTLGPQIAKVLKHFPRRGKGWSQKTLAERCKALGGGAEIDYNEKYWIYCGHKHTLPMAVSGWTIEVTAGKLDLTTGPDPKEVFNAATESANLFLQLCLIIDDAFKLGERRAIDAAFKKLKDAADSVARDHPELLR